MLKIEVFKDGPNCFCLFNANEPLDHFDPKTALPCFENEQEMLAFVKKIGAKLVPSPWYTPR